MAVTISIPEAPLWLSHEMPSHFSDLAPSRLFDELMPIVKNLNTQDGILDLEATLLYLGLGFKHIAYQEREASDVQGVELESRIDLYQFSDDYINDLVAGTGNNTTIPEFICLIQALEQQLNMARDKFTTGVTYLPGLNESSQYIAGVYCLYARHLITASLLCQMTLAKIKQSTLS